jgi:hypothetical protein
MDSEQKNLSPKCSDGSRIEASGNRSAIALRDGFNLSPAPGTGLESPETASQNLRYLAAQPSTVTVRRGFLPARQIRLARDQWDTRAGKISGHNRVGGPRRYSAALPFGKACASCALSYRAFSPLPAMSWLGLATATGAGGGENPDSSTAATSAGAGGNPDASAAAIGAGGREKPLTFTAANRRVPRPF